MGIPKHSGLLELPTLYSPKEVFSEIKIISFTFHVVISRDVQILANFSML